MDDPNRIEKQAHRYAAYEAHDQKGELVGQVDDLFVDTVNGQEYVELNMGLLGLRSTVVPLEICTVDEERMIVMIPRSKSKLRRAPRKRAPLLGDEVMAITPEYEDRIRAYFDLEAVPSPTEERPFRAFSTAYPSGDEVDRSEVRPVKARRLDPSPVQPEASRTLELADEPEVTEAVSPEPQSVEPDAVEMQDAESVEPEVVGAQSEETAGQETRQPRGDDEEPEAIDLAAVEDETLEVHGEEPEGAGTDATSPMEEVVPVPVGETRAEEVGPPNKATTETSQVAEKPDLSSPPEETEIREPVEEALSGSSIGQETESSDAGAPATAAVARTGQIDQAGQEMVEAAQRSLQALAGRAVTAQEGNLNLSRSLAQTFVEQLQSQTQGNRQAAQALQEQGQRQQQALQAIVQNSVSAYTNLLASTFSLYQKTLQSATRVALGNLQAASRLAPRGPMVPSAGAQRNAGAVLQDVEAAGEGVSSGPQKDEQEPSQQAATEDARPQRQVTEPSPTAQEIVRQNLEEAAGSSVGEGGDGSATEPVAKNPVGRSNEPAEAEAVSEEAEGTGPTSRPVPRGTGAVQEPSSGVEAGQSDDGAEEPAPEEVAPAGSSDLLLPAPPVVPNILDELPPAPRVAPVEETMSEESSEEQK